MIVRELLSVFGLDYDGKGQQKAEKGIRALQGQVDTLQTAFSRVFTATAVASPFVVLAKFASDAQENRNLLDVTFKDAAQSVVSWSTTASEALGRSRYTLSGLAADFGGLVGAMVGPGRQAAEMSMRLATLAVDLSSLQNISEDRALIVLQSALAGETEAIKRFGVDLTVAAQDQEALRLGMGKAVKGLNKAQKAQIRYNILMRDLAFVEGDAAKTLDAFANSSRAVRDGVKDLATELGFVFLPALEGGLKAARKFLAYGGNLVRQFREWAGNTNLAAGALAAVGVVLAVQLIPLLLSVLPLIAAFGVFALVADEIITTFQGGDTVLRRFSDWLDDLDSQAWTTKNALVKGIMTPVIWLRDAIGWLASTVYNLYQGITGGGWDQFKGSIESLIGPFDEWKERLEVLQPALDWIKEKFEILADVATARWQNIKDAFWGFVTWARKKFGAFYAWISPKVAGLLDVDVKGGIQEIGEFFDAFRVKIAQFLRSPLGKMLLTFLGAWAGKKLGGKAGEQVGEMIGEFLGSRRIPGSKALAGLLGEKGGALVGSLAGAIAGGGALGKLSGGLADLIDPTEATVPVGMGAKSVTIQQGDRSYKMEFYQNPGESQEDFARRINELLDEREEARDLALEQDLVPGIP